MAAKYASDFARLLQLDSKTEQKCEWSCLLWSKDHWAAQAKRAKIHLQEVKERPENSKSAEALLSNSQFLNTVAQVYSKLFNEMEQTCSVKIFSTCPFIDQREDLLRRGALASIFVTILQKATLYSMLDKHPLDSGLLDEEYAEVYGIDLTDFGDLERSLEDGRFKRLFETVTKRASQLAGLPQ